MYKRHFWQLTEAKTHVVCCVVVASVVVVCFVVVASVVVVATVVVVGCVVVISKVNFKLYIFLHTFHLFN